MRARMFSVDAMADLATMQLSRNASCLAQNVANRLIGSVVVQTVQPYLIALDAIELERVTSFQWSPYYSGTDIYSATTIDPIADGSGCDNLLAACVHRHTVGKLSPDVVFPHALASRHDPWILNNTLDVRFCNEQVYFVLLKNESDAVWLSLFDETLRSASGAGGYGIGFCTRVRHSDNKEWTAGQLDAMIDSASCVFCEALDGEGFLVWENC